VTWVKLVQMGLAGFWVLGPGGMLGQGSGTRSDGEPGFWGPGRILDQGSGTRWGTGPGFWDQAGWVLGWGWGGTSGPGARLKYFLNIALVSQLLQY